MHPKYNKIYIFMPSSLMVLLYNQEKDKAWGSIASGYTAQSDHRCKDGAVGPDYWIS